MHASRERLRLARTRRRRGRALADGLSLVARRARRAGHMPAIVLRLARGRLAVREDVASHRGSRCHQRRRARWRAPSRERKDSLDTIA